MALQSDVDGLQQRCADGTPTLSEGGWEQRCCASLARAHGSTGDFRRVLESQRSLFVSEDQLVQSERAVVANLISVYKALYGRALA
jgi:hypothetical protein